MKTKIMERRATDPSDSRDNIIVRLRRGKENDSRTAEKLAKT